MKEYVKAARKQLHDCAKQGDWDRFFDTCISSIIELYRHQQWREGMKILRDALKKTQKIRNDLRYASMLERLKSYILFFEGLETDDVQLRHEKWKQSLQALEEQEFIPEDIYILAPCYQHFIQKSSTLEKSFVLLTRYLRVAAREDVLSYVDEKGSYQEYLEDMSKKHFQLENMLHNITNVSFDQIWDAYWILMRFKWYLKDYHGVLSLADNVQVLIDKLHDNMPFYELVTAHQWCFYSSLNVQKYDEAIRWINSISRYVHYRPREIKENEIILDIHLSVLEFNGDVLRAWEEVLSYGMPVLEFLQSPQELYISERARISAMAKVYLILANAYQQGRNEITTAMEYSRFARRVFHDIPVDAGLMATWDQVELYHEELWRESLSLPNPSAWRIFNSIHPEAFFQQRVSAVGSEEHQEELFLLWLYVVYRIKKETIIHDEWWQSLDLFDRKPWSEIKDALLSQDATMLPSSEEEKQDPTGIIGIIRPLLEPRLTMSILHLKSVLNHAPESIHVKTLFITEAILMGDFISALKHWNDVSLVLKKYKDGGDAFITVMRLAIMKYLSSIVSVDGKSQDLSQGQADAFRQLKAISACFVDDDQLKYIYVRLATWKRDDLSMWPIFE